MRSSGSATSFGALLISVRPQDSTFYAGEDLVVEITFRNTARPSAPSRRPSGQSPLGQLVKGHRSAQSLVLPSPPASAPLPIRDDQRRSGPVLPMRRGLVGKGAELVLPMQRRLSGLHDGSGPPTPGSSALRTPQSAGLYAERRGPPKHAHSYSTAASSPDLLSDLGAQQAAMAMSLAQAQAHRMSNGTSRSVSGRSAASRVSFAVHGSTDRSKRRPLSPRRAWPRTTTARSTRSRRRCTPGPRHRPAIRACSRRREHRSICIAQAWMRRWMRRGATE